jgi:hypothetical protein
MFLPPLFHSAEISENKAKTRKKEEKEEANK